MTLTTYTAHLAHIGLITIKPHPLLFTGGEPTVNRNDVLLSCKRGEFTVTADMRNWTIESHRYTQSRDVEPSVSPLSNLQAAVLKADEVIARGGQ